MTGMWSYTTAGYEEKTRIDHIIVTHEGESPVNAQQLFDFLKNHLESHPASSTPVRIQVADREFDILGISASDRKILLESDPGATDALLPSCFKCGQLIDRQSHIKITLPAPMSVGTDDGEDMTEMYICERHESIIDHLNDLYATRSSDEACDLCGERVQNHNRTLVYLDRQLDPWRVLCTADTQEVIAKIVA
jgi:hypothetical protein